MLMEADAKLCMQALIIYLLLPLLDCDLLPTTVAPMIGPTAAEFRIVYWTENLGSVVFQDVSLDCEALKAGLTPNDIFIIEMCCGSAFLQRLQRFGVNFSQSERVHSETVRSRQFLVSLIRYQKKGAGIATSIRFEIQRCSLILLEAYRSKQGTRPLFDFRFDAFKGRFGGCMTALSGECNASISVNHFNFDLKEWESTVEVVNIDVSVEQMPNELVSSDVLLLEKCRDRSLTLSLAAACECFNKRNRGYERD
jgi:hypothetical protein